MEQQAKSRSLTGAPAKLREEFARIDVESSAAASTKKPKGRRRSITTPSELKNVARNVARQPPPQQLVVPPKQQSELAAASEKASTFSSSPVSSMTRKKYDRMSQKIKYSAFSIPRDIVTRVRVFRSVQGYGMTIEGPDMKSDANKIGDQGIFISRIQKGGPADRTGLLESSMRIIRINGRDFFNETAEAARQEMVGQDSVELEVYLPSDWKNFLTGVDGSNNHQSDPNHAHVRFDKPTQGPSGARAPDTAEASVVGSISRESTQTPADESLAQDKQHVVLELIDGEKNYVASLKFIVRVYVDMLRRYDPDKINIYFSNIEEILEVNHNLMEELEIEYELTNGASLSKCFNRVVPQLQAYIKYCGHMAFMKREIELLHGKKVSKDKIKLAEIFLDASSDSAGSKLPCARWPLKDLIALPFQRICRYPLLVERILKKTSPNSPDHGRLKQTLERLKRMVAVINTEKDKYDHLFSVASCLKEYSGRPLHHLGELVLEGDIQVREMVTKRRDTLTMFSRGVQSTPPQNATLLFTDIVGRRLVLLVTQIKQSTGSTQYITKCTKIMTDDSIVRLGDSFEIVGADEDLPNCWTVASKMSIFVLSAPTPEIRDLWIKTIEQQVARIGDQNTSPARLSFDRGYSEATAIEFEMSRYEISWFEKLEHGTFGEVWCGQYGRALDVTVLKVYDWIGREDIITEITGLKRLEHDNIVKIHGVCADENPVLVVSEIFDAGNLSQFLVDGVGITLEFAVLTNIADQICSGMIYLSSMNVVHGDLRSENIQMGHDSSGAIAAKIANFGLTKIIMKYSSHEAWAATNNLIAPEALQTNSYSVKSDIWGFGVILYEILMDGTRPAEKDFQHNAARLPCPSNLRYPQSTTQFVHSISLQCWQQIPENRPAFAEVLELLSRVNRSTDHAKPIPWKSLSQEGLKTAFQVVNSAVDVCRTSLQWNGGILDVLVTRIKDVNIVNDVDAVYADSNLMTNINHANLARFLGIATGPHPLCFVEEFSSHNGSLLSFLRKTKKYTALPIASTVQIAISICNGMEFLHQRQIFHGALCCENVAYGRSGKCKINNLIFGRNRRLSETQHFNRWMAPEVIQQSTLTMSGDLWSYGVVLFELLTMGEQPFRDEPEDRRVAALIMSGCHVPRPARAFASIDNLMQSCFVKPSERPSFAELNIKLAEPSVRDVEMFVVSIQSAWRGFKSRQMIRNAVLEVKHRWEEKMRILSIWCRYAYRLDISQMSMVEKSELITDVLNDVARIRTTVFDKTGVGPSVSVVVDAYAQAQGNRELCHKILMEAQGVSMSGAEDINEKQAIAAEDLPAPPGFGDGDTVQSPDKSKLHFSNEWPVVTAEEDTRAIFFVLKGYIADPASNLEAANNALETFVDDEYVENIDSLLEDLGWTQDSPNLSPELAVRITDLLSNLVI